MMTQNTPQPICQSPRPQIFCKFLLDALIFFKFMSGHSQLAVKSTINEQTTVKFPTTCHTTYSNYFKSIKGSNPAAERMALLVHSNQEQQSASQCSGAAFHSLVSVAT